MDIINDVDLTILIRNDKSALLVLYFYNSIFNGKSRCGSSKICLFLFFSQSYWKGYCSTVIFNFFQIIMVCLCLALHDDYFIMFKDSNVFEFTNFRFKTKCINTVVYSVNSNYLFSKGKQEKKWLKELFD